MSIFIRIILISIVSTVNSGKFTRISMDTGYWTLNQYYYYIILMVGVDDDVFVILKPGFCLAAKVIELILLPTVNTYLFPSADIHGLRRGHSTIYYIYTLLQLITDVAIGFNQNKPPYLTICIPYTTTY